jgi:hypothetical protein
LGVDCPDGLGARDSRIFVLVVAALVGEIAIGLWIIVVVGGITTVQRMVIASRALFASERASDEELGDPQARRP